MNQYVEYALTGFAFMMLAAFGASLWMAHRGPRQFDLTELITHDGHLDNAKFCQIGAFFVSSYVIYFMTLKGQLTEWAFGLYMGAWVGARVASLWAKLKGQSMGEKTDARTKT